MRGLKYGIVMATGVVWAACVLSCAPHGGRAPGEEEIPGVVSAPGELKFSVRVTPGRFTQGDRVTMEASLFNDSEKPYKKKFHDTCIWDYEVTNEDGTPLRPERACMPQDSVMLLEPGELRMIMREWSGRQRYFDAGQPLAPGRYRVIAGFLDDQHRVIPMSIPEEIEIVAPRSGR
ncbi:MAG TPA: hypothetical protein VFX92_11955 [Candidatus Krumholzibacteria bacterium]|nr:hypothetical protein [Candidatus Krumholzibacteria bacterium]